MSKHKMTLLNKALYGFLPILMISTAQASSPLWTFTPLTATTQSILTNGTAVVQYQVDNQSAKAKRLTMLPLQGVDAGSDCVLAPRGQAGSSCLLTLTINGSTIPTQGIKEGPRLCQANAGGSPNPNQCYQPAVSNILNISLMSMPSDTTLTSSVNELALSVTNLTNGPMGSAVPSGKSRLVTITNTGASDAINLTVTAPTWPAGTTHSTTCGTTLAAGDICTITIMPGNTATSDGTNPCSSGTGTAPVPGQISVTADNANTVNTNVVVLDYGCIFQGGYLFAIDDTTANTSSIGGKVAATSDQAATRWGPGSIAVGGINELSMAGVNSCDGNSDGQCDTNRIVNAGLAPPVAAQICADLSAGGRDDWYLPAICEVGYDPSSAGTGCGTQANPTLQNLFSTLKENNRGNLANDFYWTSTEFSVIPDDIAWIVDFNPGNGDQLTEDKTVDHQVRCIRIFAP
ncbi:DUF1566 domain-containing protein [Legionella spiritensis]|uniref:DUF1566 domain-containing protein n=1 Tax=Legionella spiritensis TaxID=452 RepID=UPI000F6F27B9|nr:DUF1566 domain-containing protein [Legionella spiritensis]VEG91312.1 transmembrane protein (fibronectin III domain and Gp5 C-terminal repeat) [Legionella spiritensis]